MTLSDQPVDAINLFATPGLFQCLSCISFGKNFEQSTSIVMQSNFAKRQFEFVVFVSYIVLLHFIPVVLNLSTHSYPRELSLNFLVPLV